jgi:FixJ family two-component response regulator
MATYYDRRIDRRADLPQAPLIACIDDDPTILEAIEDFLDASGFVAEGYLSAEDFLRSGHISCASCLITDVKLGGISGLELQERLITSGVTIPTIVVSAFADEKMQARALGSGAVCFLSKPITKDGLLDCISSALCRRTEDGG